MTKTPLAMTTVAPVTSAAVGFADQKIQSMANAHRIEVYSKGPTTDGGARRKASVIQYCPSAPLAPTSASHPQSLTGIGRQSPTDINAVAEPTRTRNQNTRPVLELLRLKDRTVSALS